MEHLENDMDDLFRKAGDLYPLKTNGADWEGLLDKMREDNPADQSSRPGNQSEGGRNKRRWSLLLLLIPLGIGSMIYFTSDHVKSKSDPAITSEQAPANDRAEKAGLNPADNSKQPEKLPAAGDEVVSGTVRKAAASTVASAARLAADKSQHQKISSSKVKNPETPADQTMVSLNSAGSLENKNRSAASDLSSTKSKEMEAAVVVAGNEIAEDGKTAGASASGTKINQTDSAHASAAKPVTKNDTVASNKTPKSKTQDQVSRGFYLGLLAGPDWTTVKFQSVKQTGYSFGATVGYRFNKRFSVETGFILDKKYYYSTGEYFNTGKTNLPTDETVIDLNGNCYMFEIPVLVRYDFAFQKNHRFFASAGFSSYLMKKENYNVNLQPNAGGPAWPYPPTSYLNSTKNLISILQLSAGYERNISQKTKIQIQPYIKIPLQGIGIGSLPLSSAGIYFGITHSFK